MLNLTAIQTAMTLRGLTSRSLAHACDVNTVAVSKWLSGESVPRIRRLERLARVLGLPTEALWKPEAESNIHLAYVTRFGVPTSEGLDAVQEIASHLRQLVPYFKRSPLSAARLVTPQCDDDYARSVATAVRQKLGLGTTEPMRLEELVTAIQSTDAVLVPVPWSRDFMGPEAVLNIHLADSQTSFIVFSTGVRSLELTHALAYGLGRHLAMPAMSGDALEAFAESFAQELVYPNLAATLAFVNIAKAEDPLERVVALADTFGVDPVIVALALDRAAVALGNEPLNLLTPAFQAEWMESRETSGSVFHIEPSQEPRSEAVDDYIAFCEARFGAPVFQALREFQAADGGHNPAFVGGTFGLPALFIGCQMARSLWASRRLQGTAMPLPAVVADELHELPPVPAGVA